MCNEVNAALNHALFKGDTESIFGAVLRELDAVFQAPGVQLFVGPGCGPVQVVIVEVLESHFALRLCRLRLMQ